VEADSEVISLATKCLDKIGLRKIGVFINDRILMESILEEVGIKENPLEVFRIIDKIGKIDEQNVISELRALKLKDDQIKKIMEIVENKGEFSKISSYLQNEFKSKKLRSRLKSLEELFNLLNSYGIGRYLNLDLSIVRGLDYYTSIVFEIYEVNNSQKLGSSLCGGGRYDNLIEIYAKEKVPATGFAIGVDRIIEALERLKLFPIEKRAKALVISDSRNSISIAEKLRSIGVITLVDVCNRSLSKNLSFADKLKIDWVIIYKEKEMQKKVVKIRNMASGEEKEIKFDELESFFKGF